jgi:hypothetical protein
MWTNMAELQEHYRRRYNRRTFGEIEDEHDGDDFQLKNN